ncbi:MAG: hypothetical protein L0387_03660 [Acidobacteria bacterium]|nr:hypothetical protein [Acidobacteriota bacterium]MCI0620757.1 hypothetical protein [Acidobacteriota bacterium]MCI0719683.1 hypothetical protein [Acidobacteriota bacterium]
MDKARVFADFHNSDIHGRLRLNCVGTVEDLNQQQVTLEDGLSLTLYSEDLEVDGLVRYSQEEHLWVAVIDWNAISRVDSKALSTDPSLRQRRMA